MRTLVKSNQTSSQVKNGGGCQEQGKARDSKRNRAETVTTMENPMLFLEAGAEGGGERSLKVLLAVNFCKSSLCEMTEQLKLNG